MSPAEEGQDETDSGASPEGEKEGEVREHVVDILFSKNKLSGLQKQVNHCVTHSLCGMTSVQQVLSPPSLPLLLWYELSLSPLSLSLPPSLPPSQFGSQIVHSVHTEMERIKEEWEAAVSKPAPPKLARQPSSKSLGTEAVPEVSDTYCYELLSMLFGLSQSDVGCAFLAEQEKLVQDLFTLLHTSSERVQLQVRTDSLATYPGLPSLLFPREGLGTRLLTPSCCRIDVVFLAYIKLPHTQAFPHCFFFSEGRPGYEATDSLLLPREGLGTRPRTPSCCQGKAWVRGHGLPPAAKGRLGYKATDSLLLPD